MSEYKIWDKTTKVITPIGEVLTPEKWIERYPVAEILDTVCAGGAVNGAFFGVYSEMISMYEKQGCDFSNCTTQQEHLDAIEAFQDAQNAAASSSVSTDERIAAALEAQVMMAMDDEEEVEE